MSSRTQAVHCPISAYILGRQTCLGQMTISHLGRKAAYGFLICCQETDMQSLNHLLQSFLMDGLTSLYLANAASQTQHAIAQELCQRWLLELCFHCCHLFQQSSSSHCLLHTSFQSSHSSWLAACVCCWLERCLAHKAKCHLDGLCRTQMCLHHMSCSCCMFQFLMRLKMHLLKQCHCLWATQSSYSKHVLWHIHLVKCLCVLELVS